MRQFPFLFPLMIGFGCLKVLTEPTNPTDIPSAQVNILTLSRTVAKECEDVEWRPDYPHAWIVPQELNCDLTKAPWPVWTDSPNRRPQDRPFVVPDKWTNEADALVWWKGEQAIPNGAKHVHATGIGNKHMNALGAVTDVVSISIHGFAGSKINLVSLEHLTQLQMLDIGGNGHLIAVDLVSLEHLTELQTLGFSDNYRLPALDLGPLEHLTKLQTLHLGENAHLTVLDLTPLKHLTELRTLDLSRNRGLMGRTSPHSNISPSYEGST